MERARHLSNLWVVRQHLDILVKMLEGKHIDMRKKRSWDRLIDNGIISRREGKHNHPKFYLTTYGMDLIKEATK